MKVSQDLRLKLGPMMDLYLPPMKALSLIKWVEEVEKFMEMIPDSVQDIKNGKDALLNNKPEVLSEQIINNSVFRSGGERK